MLNSSLAVSVPWDAEGRKNRTGTSNTGGPPDRYPEVQQALTVEDNAGRVLLWYLPDLLTAERQVCWTMVLRFNSMIRTD